MLLMADTHTQRDRHTQIVCVRANPKMCYIFELKVIILEHYKPSKKSVVYTFARLSPSLARKCKSVTFHDFCLTDCIRSYPC
ncbi:hypothetical protein FKM82_007749 [Ascaphus truei]